MPTLPMKDELDGRLGRGQPAAAAAAPGGQAGAPAAREVQTHWILLILSVLILGLSFLLRVPGEERVYLPLLDHMPLPSLCSSRALLGVPCPGCGLTRCFICLAHGQLARAWHFNPAGFLLFALVVGQVPYRIAQLWRIGHGHRALRPAKLDWFFYLILAVLLLQWFPKLLDRFL